MDKLRGWADGHSKEYEVIAQKRDADAVVADRALEIVRQFIIERKLILYGGQAIDFALRLKGSGIYPEHQTPDYDFFSPQSVDDAYDLADRLVAAGFDNVSAIPAIHVQTMRVATNFIFVADISYTPPEVYESLPTVSYAGMRILHPNYQRTDMHLAFCFPFNNPPREDIFHRYKKDLQRFQLFQKFYPITDKDTLTVAKGSSETPFVAEVDLARVAIHGFAGYALIRQACEELIKAAEGAKLTEAVASARKLYDETPSLDIAISQAESSGRTEIRFVPPKSSRLALATPWPDEVVADLTRGGVAVEWYAPYMDSRPLMARTADVDVYSTRNRLLAVSKILCGESVVTVASAQYILLNFLYEAHAASEQDDRDLYVVYYKALLALLEAGGDLIAALRSEGAGPEVSAETYRSFVESSPFGLPVTTIGDVNRDSSYLIRLANSARQVGDEPPGIDPTDLPDLANVPARYFPGGKHTVGEHPSFEYSANIAFQRAGKPLTPIIEGGGASFMPDMAASAAAKKPTFLVLTTQLDGGVLEEILSSAGWRKIGIREAQRSGADCVVVGGRYNSDRRLWHVRAGVKSRLQILVLTNKVQLHESLLADPARRGFVCETHVVSATSSSPPKIPGPGVWIWRPGDGWSGKDIYVFSTQDELDKIWQRYADAAPKIPALISKYIENPLLIDIDGEHHKMHLRLYFLVAVIPKGTVAPEGRRAALMREGVIVNAAKPYSSAEFQDKGIHDTHAAASRGSRFPRDYPGGADKAATIFDSAAKMLGSVAELALPTAAPYAESKGGFEILGVDFMIDTNDRLWLIEINDRVGFDGLPDASDGTNLRSWRSSFIFQSVAAFVLGVEPDDDTRREPLYLEVAKV